MMDEIKQNKFKANDYGDAPNMSLNEKKISFLNRYFVYKKIRTVNVDKVELDLEDYQEEEGITTVNKEEKAVEEKAVEEKAEKPKIKKLNKKLLLVPATEAIEEKPMFKLAEKVKTAKPKKKLIIEEDE
jgi:hypothetical protein